MTKIAAIALASSLVVGMPTGAAAAGDPVPRPDVARRLVEVLADRRVAGTESRPGMTGARGTPAGALRRQAIAAVPLVIARDGLGSGVVVYKDATAALVLTNRHVVDKPFEDVRGDPLVHVVFYNPAFAGAWFKDEDVDRCLHGGRPSAWCLALRSSQRDAAILKIAEDRDLALLWVPDPPSDTAPMSMATLGELEPGDDVAVMGHPQSFLWTLSTGIVSGIRSSEPLLKGGTVRGTVIQTQTPIAGGNSGGPLMTREGRLVGIVTWEFSSGQNVNAAIAVNEIQAFLAPEIAKLKLAPPRR